jgi:ornithine cyclodeaminase/alanine dehydrogenase-like protein (mu-crystallin family)
MDSIALTGIRTGATAALAAQYGARRDSTRAAIIGCGAQASYQLEALRSVFALESVRVFDIDTARAEAFAAAHSTSDCAVTSAASIRAAVAEVDICISCTTSKSPVLTENLDLKGCFVAAVGADNPEKQEIAPTSCAALVSWSTIWKPARRAETFTTPCARARSPNTACMPTLRSLHQAASKDA